MKATAVLFLVFSLALAGCGVGEQVVVQDRPVAVTIPASIYDCPISELPRVEGLTEVAVARLIVQLYENNVRCRNTVEAIKTLIARQEALVSAP